MTYLYGILRRDVSDEANRHNDSWLGTSTLGIEVTDVALAARCGLGNIDPQHSADGDSSAIEKALTHFLPPIATKLVTIREDKDSLGAMAVLTLRKEGRDAAIDKAFVSWVGAMDLFGFEDARKTYPELAYYFERDFRTTVLNNIAYSKDLHWRDLDAKVRDFMRIICGEMPRLEMNEIIVTSRSSRVILQEYPVEVYGPVVFIEAPGHYSDARQWGNRNYPIVLVHDPKFLTAEGLCKRYSLIRRSDADFDRAGFEEAIIGAEAQARGISRAELKALGSEWGGNPNIISSPAGVGRDSRVSKEKFIKIAVRFCRKQEQEVSYGRAS